MAYFRCTTGGSGKGNTLVVTCADDLAGATITCTNGTKTYTKTCPSTSPYEVTFYGLEAGTWTISATVSGNTYTTTVVVADIEALLGGFNWKTWVDLSENYTSSDFTDLDDLLSDETAIRELMTIHACVDYLADIATTSADVETIIDNDLCAKWINLRDYALDTLYANEIIAGYMDTADKYFYGEWVITDNTTTPPTWGPKGNVPVMTSNSAPYGEASASSEYDSTMAAWKAFDGDETTNWNTRVETNATLTYIFTNPICPKRVKIRPLYNVAGRAKNFKIQGSNDGTTFVDLTETLQCTNTSDNQYFDIDTDDYYLYLRIAVADAWGAYYIGIITAQFYGRELSVSVPTMTGNTTPYGEVTVSSYYQSGYEGFRAFDDTNGGWNPASSDSVNNANLVYKFTDYVNPVMFGGSGARDAASSGTNTVKLLVSKDGQTWVDTTKSVVIDRYTLSKVFNTVSLTDGYKYFKFLITAVDNMSIAGGWGNKFFLYGKDYSEKEFEEGTTKKWLYDHGVELETLSDAIFGSGSTITDGADNITLAGGSTGSLAGKFVNMDFTPYSLIRARIVDELLNYATISIGSSISTAVACFDGGYTQYDASNANLPNNLSHDISSINQTKYGGIYVGNSGKVKVAELWLE